MDKRIKTDTSLLKSECLIKSQREKGSSYAYLRCQFWVFSIIKEFTQIYIPKQRIESLFVHLRWQLFFFVMRQGYLAGVWFPLWFRQPQQLAHYTKMETILLVSSKLIEHRKYMIFEFPGISIKVCCIISKDIASCFSYN